MFGTSPDPEVAFAEVEAALFLLTTFGYIDGDFADSERQFVEGWIYGNVTPQLREPAVDLFRSLDTQIAELFGESVAHGEEQADFVYSRLKTRCYEVFQGMPADVQDSLLDRLDELLMADGVVHPAEVRFRAELAELLEAELGIELVEDDEPGGKVVVRPPAPAAVGAPPSAHPFFEPLEQHYSLQPETLGQQVRHDLELIIKTTETWERLRAFGEGRLAGHHAVTELEGESPFLDGHVHAVPAKPGREYELTVLGDLHGCYSCLKAAVMQSRFFDRVGEYKQSPDTAPFPLLVMLGDYIDRGIYSFNGVLRGALEIFLRVPEHVVLLRGNHEYFLEVGDKIIGGVRPAEAIATMTPHLPADVFRRYRTFFEDMPVWCLFDRTVFVHAGIPRDDTLAEHWTDLSSLSHPDIRFESIWSDPSEVDFIPRPLQARTNRFPFGRMQAQAFMRRIGANVLIRGHEKVNEGFRRVYDDGAILLCTLFSAGGADNDDLPEKSSYRKVTPMALTLRRTAEGDTELLPWRIDYAAYNRPEFNAFYRSPPVIPHTAR